MPLFNDFTLYRYDKGTVVLSLIPATSVVGWSLKFEMTKRKEGTPIITNYAASGYSTGQSGINVTNGGEGVMAITLYPEFVSGKDIGNYYFSLKRTDSGLESTLAEGYRQMR